MNGFANFVNHSSKRTERERRLGRGTRGEMAKKEEAKTRGKVQCGLQASQPLRWGQVYTTTPRSMAFTPAGRPF